MIRELATKGRQILAISKENAPFILACMSGIGTISAVIFSAEGTPRAIQLVKEAEEKKGEPLTKAEKIKACWRPYVPAGVSLVVSLGSLAAAMIVSNKRAAAIASLYSASELALEQYRNKTKELVGEKKEAEINEASERALAAPSESDSTDPIPTGLGDELFLDTFTGTKFKSSRTAVERAVNEICHRICAGEYCQSLNDLRYEMRIGNVDVGELVGFNPDHMPEYRFIYPEDGSTYIKLQFKGSGRPFFGYNKIY